MNQPSVKYVGGRSCDGCTMCCKLLKIEELKKPKSQWCVHCDIGSGCKIYDERPSECRTFNCGFLTEAHIGDHWKPTKSKMVVALATTGDRITVFVDADRPAAWRKEPYYSDLKRWSRAIAQNQGRVVVSQGANVIAVTPDGETNLGSVKDDQLIIARRKRGAGGSEIEHIVVDRDDPVVEALTLLKDSEASKAASPEELAKAKRLVDAWTAGQDN